LLEPVPTTYCPSAAAPVPVSLRYQPFGRSDDGDVTGLRLSRCSTNPAAEVIEIDPEPDEPAARNPTANVAATNDTVKRRRVRLKVT
jgi:hypothetical protein